MNNQQIFNKVVKHLRNQGEKSVNEKQVCKYRLRKDGKLLKCAAGCLIPDKEYNEKMENKAVVDVSFFEKNFPQSLSLIFVLQNTHDFTDVDAWEDEWKFIADQFSLTYETPQKTNNK